MAAAYLASPFRRIAASAVDFALIVLLVIVTAGVLQELRVNAAAIGLGSILVFIGYHTSFLRYWSGESPGRRMLSIRVVSARKAVDLALVQCVGRPVVRFAWLISGALLERRLGIPWLGFAPLFIDLVLLTTLPSRQTVADLICRTVVVNMPPPQPHRAPAGPMYSATDAEFGVRPARH